MQWNSPAVETVEGGRRFPTTPMHGIATTQLIGVSITLVSRIRNVGDRLHTM